MSNRAKSLDFYNKSGNVFQTLPDGYFYVRCVNFQCVKISQYFKKVKIWGKDFVISKEKSSYTVSEYLTGLLIFKTNSVENIEEKIESTLKANFKSEDFLWAVYAKPQINDESNHYRFNSIGVNGTYSWAIYS